MNHWSTHQLTEFFAAVCGPRDEQAAITVAVERAAEVLEAEVAAMLTGDGVQMVRGVDRDLLESALPDGPSPGVLALPGLGELHVSVARFGSEPRGTLLVARVGEPLAPEERQLLQAMGQTLDLALHNIALLAAERRLREEREREAAERLALVASLREARHDSLTGLPTRVLFLEILGAKLDEGGPVSVLFIDLDRFKAVNDSLGHRAGDDLLGHVAGRIRDCLGPAGAGARLGGDEFAVLLGGSTTENAVPVAWRIIEALRRPFRIAGRDVFIGASIGIATGTAGTDPGELLGNADVAMYKAKKDGPGKVILFEPWMHAEALAQLTLGGELRRALELDEFRLLYQPLIRMETGAATGVEALVRWSRPGRGYVPPADFLPLAEENGLITDIGRWVLRAAGHQAARWRRTIPEMTLNVNVSGRQLTDPRFTGDVEKTLAECGLPAAAVTLELTESVLMSDPRTAIACLGDLRDLGVGLAVDDFGTGYSSLSYLQRLPVDELKIDRTFISRAEPTAADLAVIRTVVELARTLKLRTVVEGVETEQQHRAMRALGCDYGQGYHLCRPLEPENVPAAFAGPLAIHPGG
ncbi:putative bifunctional diguanylate cyclase/phosphodiesterase [Actinoplanes flavus]|uniref:EAL domain-containing protein n=1 Tax=Actinoplanes flavus TaxID=2820290 RepID=A0ABS3UXN7_9ACTN|nr:EAL domain-containing protein [Actinoplanes flavus]MBO3743356.1 EAL domain-containing protein [Actinoplanes flavus]